MPTWSHNTLKFTVGETSKSFPHFRPPSFETLVGQIIGFVLRSVGSVGSLSVNGFFSENTDKRGIRLFNQRRLCKKIVFFAGFSIQGDFHHERMTFYTSVSQQVTYFWVAKTCVIVIFGSPNCLLLCFVGRKLPTVENHCFRQLNKFTLFTFFGQVNRLTELLPGQRR